MSEALRARLVRLAAGLEADLRVAEARGVRQAIALLDDHLQRVPPRLVVRMPDGSKATYYSEPMGVSPVPTPNAVLHALQASADERLPHKRLPKGCKLALEQAGFVRVADLTRATQAELEAIPSVGRGGARICANLLAQCGLSFRAV